MPYFACPANTYRQPQKISALDPVLQRYLSHLVHQNSQSSGKSNDKKGQNSGASSKHNDQSAANRTYPTFSPNFDVFETSDSYYLEGDLPGLDDSKNIDIEFSDNNTLTIRGTIERSKTVPTPTDTTTSTALDQEQTTESRRKSLNPTVEETEDEDDYSIVSNSSQKRSSKLENSEQHKVHKRKDESTQQEPPRKVWLSERVCGNFHRTFSFPSPVVPDSVTAKFQNGVLSITVPKAVFSGVRKIAID